MKKDPKIAVFMSCYNHEKYVGQAMECIINQTYPNWELFVANDGSTDNTGKIIESYQDPRIHYYDFKENTKMVGAIKVLYDEIKARDFDYVHSMASDDYIDEDKFRQQIDFFKNNPQYKVCFTWDKVVFDNGAPYSENYSHKTNRNRFDWLAYYFEFENCMNANSVLIDKDLFFKYGGVNEYYIQTGDFKMWFEMAAQMPFYVIQKELTYYRRHETNLSNVTIARLVRSANEQMTFVRNIIFNMDRDCFARSFYKFLPYISIEDDSELWAAKFYLLASMNRAKMDSIALDIYYSHCDDNKFTGVLEKLYFFGNAEFYDYSGNAGCGWMLEEMLKLNLDRSTKKISRLSEILLDNIDRNQLGEETLANLSYSTLCDLYNVTTQIEGGREYFGKIKEVIRLFRNKAWDKKEKGNTLLVIAPGSEWKPTNEFVESVNSESIYYTYINNEEDAMTNKPIDMSQKSMPEEFQYVDLADTQEMCMIFANKKIDNLRRIYYIDCISEDYEWVKMVAGYPLMIEQYAIMKKEDFEKCGGAVPFQVLAIENLSVY